MAKDHGRSHFNLYFMCICIVLLLQTCDFLKNIHKDLSTQGPWDVFYFIIKQMLIVPENCMIL